MAAHRAALHSFLSLLFLCASACNRGPTWDWREDYVVTCEVNAELAEVFVRAPEDLPSGTVISVPELPELDDTINNSGIYMTHASLVPLPTGRHTLTFNASSGEETASVSCQIERPVFTATAEAVSLETPPFARGTVVYEWGPEGADERKTLKAAADVDEQGRYRVGFMVWNPTKIEVTSEASEASEIVEANERGQFRVPVAPTPDAVTRFSVSNTDGQSTSYELKLLEFYPWAEDDLSSLRSGGEAGYAWAAEPKADRPKGEATPTILINADAEVLAQYGDFLTLAEVERLAWMSVTGETVVETCKYGAPDGTQAEIERIKTEAEIVVREAKTGAEVARKSFSGKPPGCPDAADFTVWRTEGESDGVAFNQRIEGDVAGAAQAWFEKLASKSK